MFFRKWVSLERCCWISPRIFYCISWGFYWWRSWRSVRISTKLRKSRGNERRRCQCGMIGPLFLWLITYLVIVVWWINGMANTLGVLIAQHVIIKDHFRLWTLLEFVLFMLVFLLWLCFDLVFLVRYHCAIVFIAKVLESLIIPLILF